MMAISKKGLRKINVNGQIYLWKFNEKILITNNEIDGSLLIVDFGWYDLWLFPNNNEHRPPDFEPKSVTPEFVSKSISYALSKGWEKGKMHITFRDGTYKI